MATSLVGGLIGGGASIIGGLLGADAAEDAANIQAQSAQRGQNIVRQMFEQTRSDLSPFRQVGGAALNEIAALYGLGGDGVAGSPLGPMPEGGFPRTQGTDFPGKVDVVVEGPEGNRYLKSVWPRNLPAGSNVPLPEFGTRGTVVGRPGDFGPAGEEPQSRAEAQEAAFDRFFTSPGYNFRLDEGLRAIERNRAARGLLRSGGTLREITRYGQGLASGEWNNYVNRLAQLAGAGQNAAAQTGAFGQTAAGQQAQALMSGGTALASGRVGAANALNQGIAGVLSAFSPQIYGGFGFPGAAGAPMSGTFATGPHVVSPGAFDAAAGRTMPFNIPMQPRPPVPI